MTRGLFFGAALLIAPLAGCQMMVDGADKLGSYMPTIGDRCEHWQCITPSGQAQSDAIKQNQGPDKDKEAMIHRDWVENPPDFPTTAAKATPAATKAPAQNTSSDDYKSR